MLDLLSFDIETLKLKVKRASSESFKPSEYHFHVSTRWHLDYFYALYNFILIMAYRLNGIYFKGSIEYQWNLEGADALRSNNIKESILTRTVTSRSRSVKGLRGAQGCLNHARPCKFLSTKLLEYMSRRKFYGFNPMVGYTIDQIENFRPIWWVVAEKFTKRL